MKKEIEDLHKVIAENDSYQNSYETDLFDMFASIKVHVFMIGLQISEEENA